MMSTSKYLLVQRRETCLKQIQIRPIHELADRNTAFTAKFYAVYELHEIAQQHPEMIDSRTVTILENLLKDTALAGMRQSLFLFREAAGTLCACFSSGDRPGTTARQALHCLQSVLRTTEGPAHRAVAEAMGSLPTFIQGLEIQPKSSQNTPRIYWQEVVKRTGYEAEGRPVFIGRSLVARLKGGNLVLVLKLARPDDSPETLAGETFWMNHLRSNSDAFEKRFDVPTEIKIAGHPVFKVTGLPVKQPEGTRLHAKGYAIGYIAPREYFSYPNAPSDGRPLAAAEFTEIVARNAYLLGKLAAMGIVHEAPIPLFHNRVQQDRRRDHGRYEWFRAGRLDQWLASCDYPNLGPTGLRDFEHLATCNARGAGIYRNIGTHLLSLLLVAGSYFRNQNPERVGLDPKGHPVDARDLFDPGIMNKIVLEIFRGYYHGFVGTQFSAELPLDLDRLTERMIEEMGVDRHMEERFRVVDQNQLSDAQFVEFLTRRGFSSEKIEKMDKGARDIIIYSGPHLGGFNDRISLPELIAAVETMAAVCVCGKHLQEKIPVAAAA